MPTPSLPDAACENDRGATRETAADRIAVVIPTLNEEQSIADVVRSIPRAVASRIIVADGGSRDATAARAENAGAHVIHAGRGYCRACLAGALAAEFVAPTEITIADSSTPATTATQASPSATAAATPAASTRRRTPRRKGCTPTGSTACGSSASSASASRSH